MKKVLSIFRIYYLAYHDLATGCYNRNKYELVRFCKCRRKLYVALVDINDLKNQNKISYAHGDEVIKRVADKLKGLPDAEVYRIGGDEFVVLSRVPLFLVGDKDFSVGITIKPRGMSLEEVFSKAEIKMNTNKKEIKENLKEE